MLMWMMWRRMDMTTEWRWRFASFSFSSFDVLVGRRRISGHDSLCVRVWMVVGGAYGRRVTGVVLCGTRLTCLLI